MPMESYIPVALDSAVELHAFLDLYNLDTGISITLHTYILNRCLANYINYGETIQ